MARRYEEGDAALLANIGSLVEPIAHSDEFYTGARRVPFSLFAHDAQQQATRAVHAQERDSPSGVMGRILTALGAAGGGASARGYSIAGNAPILEAPGAEPPTIISSKDGDGFVQYTNYESFRRELANMTSRRTSNVFASTHFELLNRQASDRTVWLRTSDPCFTALSPSANLMFHSSLETTAEFASKLRAQTQTAFPDTQLGRQLKQVAPA